MNRTLTVLIAVLAVALLGLSIRSSMNNTNKEITPEGIASPVSEKSNNYESWKEFSWKDGHFSIMLPSNPHHVRDKTKDPRTNDILYYDTFVTADNDGQGYMINTITFPRNIENGDVGTTLKNVVNDIIARNSENKLNTMKEGKFKSYPAYDFSYSNGSRIIHGKVFAVIDTVYMLGVIDTTPEENPKELDFFMNSFNIINDPTKK